MPVSVLMIGLLASGTGTPELTSPARKGWEAKAPANVTLWPAAILMHRGA